MFETMKCPMEAFSLGMNIKFWMNVYSKEQLANLPQIKMLEDYY